MKQTGSICGTALCDESVYFLMKDFLTFLTFLKKSCASVVPINHALKKAYNKPAKGKVSIIGFTRRKQAVAQLNVSRHEKERISSFLRSICHLKGTRNSYFCLTTKNHL